MAPDSINVSGGDISVNGRSYRLPKQPIVVVCVDGSEPGYIERAVEAGQAPWFARVLKEGTNLIGDCVVPSFTNPNNLSIVTGRPPSVHGICGNYFLDPDTGKEVMMNDPKFLRIETLFPAFQRAGCRIAVVTAKDKLRGLLGKGLELGAGKACSFSSEKSDKATLAENGIDHVNELVGMGVPDVYSAGLSEFVFAAGVKLMERDRPQIMYLSTTDYIQHKQAPGTPVANAFYAMMDGYLGKLDAMGCTIVVTADHGMNAKFGSDGQPDVIYLQDVFDGWVGKDKARVILPITDPYVVHHGALGSFAVVYCTNPTEWAAKLKAMPGIEAALTKEEAAAKFELPADRLGDLIVVSTQHKVLGTSASRHDLSGLTEPLRSHGGISEQRVPLLCNRKLADGAAAASHRWRNFDAFDLALNLVA
ncbi:phosphonoacetate hydrolase [Reyranella sp. MMS21-HV4-11]|uniref:Phosphonoacetate hydrolase n=1 Tax=Reyranella humidisoli TaxID=2849149 RepID=A0ABS6IKV2_9HYPH|nr:phosphonoacetate hydrolase [Reyranella sp. MMS21-HV4-11]MBU8875221.1 phosphonoacetate hydrolase [Reyranella sp. MMS21-HV4-11]